jgi:L-histidine N-alpha-methyltransferase
MSDSPERLAIDVYLNEAGQLATMADEVRRGLSTSPRSLPSKYFYDARGSELFEEITALPEYYQTRTEAAMLREMAPTLMAEGAFSELVEIGSGSANKTRTLLDAMERNGSLLRYVPIDVSAQVLRDSAAALMARYRMLRVHGVVGDFQCHLARTPQAEGRRLVIFLGSTIGNLEVDERVAFLRDVRGLLHQGDAFLLGVDLVKDVDVLEAAYNDSAGVTAEFNRNILRVVNRELAANFDVEAFGHHAFYNREHDRIEMHLIPDTPQTVRVAAIDLMTTIGPDESIRTEISCKFTRESVSTMLAAAGLRLERWFTDPDGRFGLALAVPLAVPGEAGAS